MTHYPNDWRIDVAPAGGYTVDVIENAVAD